MSSTNSKTSKSSIEFKLFAPYNESVVLIGEWNNWQSTLMKKDDKGWWHVVVPLADGQYQYQFKLKSKSYFMVDEEAIIADPRAVALTMDEHEKAIVTVKNGKSVVTTYQWKNDGKPLPANDELVIYEMHVGDFSGGPGDDLDKNPKGRFQNIIDKLDYITNLGINAIELMPCNEFPGERSWGYNPRSIFAVENNYGTPEDLCRLVDECHGRGIRVIHDGVYNHSEDSASLTKIDYTYWYYQDNPDEPSNRFGPKFDYEHRDENLNVWPARQEVRDAILYWIDNFHIDGVRFDATYLIKHFDFLSWLHSEIFQHIKNKPFYTIAENIPQDPAIAGPDGPLDAAWHEHYRQQLTATLTGQPFEGSEPYNLDGLLGVLDPRNDGFGGAFNVVNYVDNHDHDRIMWTLGQNNFVDVPAFRRNKLGFSILITSAGVPMLYMGQEFAESAAKTTDWQRLDWALLQNQTNSDLLHYYSGLIYLRKTNRALQSNNFEAIYKDDERAILAYKRWDDGGVVVVVVVNLKDEFAGEIHIENWPGDGKWHEYHNNYDTEIQGGVLNDTLAESEVKIFIKS